MKIRTKKSSFYTLFINKILSIYKIFEITKTICIDKNYLYKCLMINILKKILLKICFMYL